MSGVIKVSAPGKVILHGEHSVVYGKRAIAVSVDLCTTLTVTAQQNGCVRMIFPEVDIDLELTLNDLQTLLQQLGSNFTYETLNSASEIPIDPEIQAKLEAFCSTNIHLPIKDENLKPAQNAALQAFLFLYLGIFGRKLEPYCFKIATDLPVGAGLGSSASFAVALAGGLLKTAKFLRSSSTPSEADLHLINKWAFISEKFVHGSPSGVDNTVATFGHAVIFRKGEPAQLVLDCPDIHVLLVNTKVARSTKALVGKVASLKESNSDLFTKSVDGIEDIVGSALQEIKANKPVNPELVRRNQELLKTLGVSHPSLDSIVEVAQRFNLAGKLTGAGGGGCAFILIPKDFSKDKYELLQNEFKKLDMEFWDTKLGCEGFKILES